MNLAYVDPSTDCWRYLRVVEENWPQADEPPDDALMAMIERAVDQCPHLPELWLMRADLVQLHLTRTGGGKSPYTLADVLQSLQAAVRVRPDAIEAHEAIAEFCEKEANDLPAAEAAYGKAIQMGGGPWVYTGLARVLAKQGLVEQAMAALDHEFCPYHDEADVKQMRQQLRDGVFEG